MHLVIQWPDQWLAAAGSEQEYRERVTAALGPLPADNMILFSHADGSSLSEVWERGYVYCHACTISFPVWARTISFPVWARNPFADSPETEPPRRAWESKPTTPRCPLCFPVDSLRVDKLSPTDRIRLLQALADHDDVAECLAVEADRAQARLGGESHERPRAPADVLRIAELERKQQSIQHSDALYIDLPTTREAGRVLGKLVADHPHIRRFVVPIETAEHLRVTPIEPESPTSVWDGLVSMLRRGQREIAIGSPL